MTNHPNRGQAVSVRISKYVLRLEDGRYEYGEHHQPCDARGLVLRRGAKDIPQGVSHDYLSACAAAGIKPVRKPTPPPSQ